MRHVYLTNDELNTVEYLGTNYGPLIKRVVVSQYKRGRDNGFIIGMMCSAGCYMAYRFGKIVLQKSRNK